MSDSESGKGGASREEATEAGQRRINVIWEVTQAVIAICVVGTTLSVASFRDEMPCSLATLSSLVIGFYFGRTNHQRSGGIQIGR